MNDRKKLLHTLLDMAERMLLSGAEIYRVEDTIARMGTASGASDMNVFVIISSIVITMTFPDGETITETRRVTKAASNDFTVLERLNHLSRQYCMEPFSWQELEHRLAETAETHEHPLSLYAGSALASGGFAVFFGGSVWDGLAAGVLGVLIGLVQKKVRGFFPNTVSFNLACAFAAGCLTGLLTMLFPVLHFGMIMIGDIMLLIPGVAITVSVRDMLVGDTISGSLRLIESILCAVSLAYGFILAIMATGAGA
ncbi:MAG: threonine/serine exporter family protein [Solobacterium sp.]|nr:threonine/serine exporter family protein [Solobacterium sp.]